MSNDSDSIAYPVSSNEPKVHPMIRKSFVFVPSTGMRLAPEVLVLELYREVFFSRHYGSTGGKDLDPEEMGGNGTHLYTTGEQAVLHALRGRRRKSGNAKSKPFFAPSYPSLARNGWLGKNRERIIGSLLIGGALAQHLYHSGETEEMKRKQEDLVNCLTSALIGQNSDKGDDHHGKDILSVTLGVGLFDLDEELARNNLRQKTQPGSIIKIQTDVLSERIFKDLLALCDLEKQLPRMQWLHVLMTFLRFSLPMWLLAHMRITSLLHSWLIEAIDDSKLTDPEHVEMEIGRRNQQLLHPTLTPTREIFERTEIYMKHRVELNILLYNLENARSNNFVNKQLAVRGAGSGIITVDQLLRIARDAANDIKNSQHVRLVAEGSTIRNFLTREAEQFHAWRDPLNKGQGKNIDEFFRVLYRDSIGDEAGGYLLVPEKRGKPRGFRVFPGQLLLKAITFLAAYEKKTSGAVRGGGKLALEDVENHFKQYGIDFSYAADARPLLMQELQAMGLLNGSPDAGSSVAVACPY